MNRLSQKSATGSLLSHRRTRETDTSKHVTGQIQEIYSFLIRIIDFHKSMCVYIHIKRNQIDKCIQKNTFTFNIYSLVLICCTDKENEISSLYMQGILMENIIKLTLLL